VKKLLGLVPTTLIWPLLYREPLDEWVAPTGKVVLLGDACHPMLVSPTPISFIPYKVFLQAIPCPRMCHGGEC
jgi:hypothetical protein